MLRVLMSFLKLFPEMKTFMSSAKKTYYNFLETEAKSLIYIKSNSGPRIYHCGTPHITSLMSDLLSL